MIKSKKNELLPEGLKVLFPEEATKEELLSRKILDILFQYGYLLIKTPLMEYQYNYNLSILQPQSIKHEPFILMEPETKKILVIRPDITPQIAKLASTKLAHVKRPIRLTYSGEVLRNIKNFYQSDRQFKQIGAELIGSPYNNGLQEIITLIKVIIKDLKIKNTTIDFALPSLMKILENSINFRRAEGKIIKNAIENKNTNLIKNKKFEYIKKIIECSGTLKNAKNKFIQSKFPIKIKEVLESFFQTLDLLKKKNPDLSMTVDITEGNSFLNYKNIGFKVYNKNSSDVIAIGGDYLLDNKETGVGITLITNNIINSFKDIKKTKIYVQYGTPELTLNKFKKKNRIFIRELTPNKTYKIDAKIQKYDYILDKKGSFYKPKKSIKDE